MSFTASPYPPSVSSTQSITPLFESMNGSVLSDEAVQYPIGSPSLRLESATPLSLSESSYAVLADPRASRAGLAFPLSASAARSASASVSGESATYVAMLRRLEELGFRVRALNELVLDEHGGEDADLDAVISELRELSEERK